VHGPGHGVDDRGGSEEDMEVLTSGQLHADRIDRACSTRREVGPPPAMHPQVGLKRSRR
jgi:hypothetical protein